MKKTLLIFTMILSVLAVSCTPGGSGKKSSSGADVITGYLLGDAPMGMELVVEKINEKMIEEIGAEIDIRHISWGDFASKYPLILAAGGDVDFIYTADWSYYAQESVKGAFYEITREDMDKYMPKMASLLPQDAYNQAMVDGRMYMVPTATPDKKIPVVIIREDLRKKYGVADINRFSDIEPYLEAIKANEPGMVPIFLDNSYDIDQPFTALTSEQGDRYYDILRTVGSGCGLVYASEAKVDLKLMPIIEGEVLDVFKNAAATLNNWQKKGYINPDAFANTVPSRDSFLQGRSAVAFGNSTNIQQLITTAADNDIEIKIIPILNANGHWMGNPYINNGVAIAASSDNPTKTMQALDLIMADPEYNMLAYFGVEGVNYVIEDGKVDLPEGVTAENNSYPPDMAGFWFTNKDQHPPLATWPQEYIDLRQSIIDEEMLIDYPLAAFSPKVDSIQTEVSSLNRVLTQYFYPFYVGLIDDIDGGFETLESNMKAAGIDAVQTEIQSQVDAYMSSF